jgi:hypothetical protein
MHAVNNTGKLDTQKSFVVMRGRRPAALAALPRLVFARDTILHFHGIIHYYAMYKFHLFY